MAFNGQKSSLVSRLTIDNQRTQIQINQRLLKHSTLLKVLIVVSILSILPSSNGKPLENETSFSDEFFERLPKKEIVSIGTDANEYEDGLQVYTSQEFTRSCFVKINYKQMCIEYGPNCEFKFEWSYPESLLEQIKKGFDPRIRIQDDLPVSLKNNPDYQIYSSHLLINNTGYSHRGNWSCNFKFINNDNGKIDSWQHAFNIDIIENGVRGSPCSTNDHCSSNNCKNNTCVCDADAPFLVGDLCKKELSPSSDEDSFWIKLWHDYEAYIIIGGSIAGFLLFTIICCKYCGGRQCKCVCTCKSI
ncbi:uncharacterized protein LOC107361639 [Tetranychus urticae]|uniref:Uncharacterized protein n=1 Tax=Tetranychus urticae TaxID=32264 RepID=T1JRR9_TETUR|nr:uncharacterized protein LOC107361639 [Tetranychus urticae]